MAKKMSPFNTLRLWQAGIVALAVWQLFSLYNASLSHGFSTEQEKKLSFLSLPSLQCERFKNEEVAAAFSLAESNRFKIMMEDEEEKRTRCSISGGGILHPDDCRRRRQRLEFVHIPKTAGFAIQHAAARVNIRWGYCHFFNNTKGEEEQGCPAVTRRVLGDTNNVIATRPSATLLPAGVKFPVPWHLPPMYFFETSLRHWFPHNPYAGATLFAVVRNPYSRAISEYYYRKKLGKIWINTTAINNPTVMNAWLHTHLKKMVRSKFIEVQVPSSSSVAAASRPDNQPGSNTTTTTTPIYIPHADYFQRDGHFIPQSDYIYSYSGEQRIVDVILRLEKLDTEFPALMRRFNLTNIALPPSTMHGSGTATSKHSGASSSTSNRRARIQQMGIQNLTLENIRLIELVYARDFAIFGYPTVSSHFMDQNKATIT